MNTKITQSLQEHLQADLPREEIVVLLQQEGFSQEDINAAFDWVTADIVTENTAIKRRLPKGPVPIITAVTLLVIAWLLAYFFVEKRTDIYTNNNNSMETIIEDVEIITAKSDSESSQKLLMRVSK